MGGIQSNSMQIRASMMRHHPVVIIEEISDSEKSLDINTLVKQLDDALAIPLQNLNSCASPEQNMYKNNLSLDMSFRKSHRKSHRMENMVQKENEV
jgi:hypothetical protein